MTPFNPNVLKRNDNVSPVVITSRAAADHLDWIRGQHAEMLQAMALQNQKNEMNNQQKQAEMAQERSMKGELDKEKLVASTESQKNALNFQGKVMDNDVKRASLAQKV